MACPKKTVLVQLDSFNRKITVQCEEGAIEVDLLLTQVRDAYYKERIQPDDVVTLQVKDTDFDGMFVDFLEGEIVDKSVFRVIIEKAQVKI